jgi:hypothetical protein
MDATSVADALEEIERLTRTRSFYSLNLWERCPETKARIDREREEALARRLGKAAARRFLAVTQQGGRAQHACTVFTQHINRGEQAGALVEFGAAEDAEVFVGGNDLDTLRRSSPVFDGVALSIGREVLTIGGHAQIHSPDGASRREPAWLVRVAASCYCTAT